MVEFKRRMPRFEKIPQIIATKENIDNLKKINFKHDIITVIRLRHAKLRFDNVDEITIAAIKKISPNDGRTKEIVENIGKVKTTEDYDALFAFLSTKTGHDSISSLIRKLRNKKCDFYKDVLSKLNTGYNDIFLDNAILILGNEYSNRDISNDIIDTLKTNTIRDPLDFSSLLMILGKSKDSRYLNILYSFYIFFKDNFADDEYYEGPLIGINEINGKLEYKLIGR